MTARLFSGDLIKRCSLNPAQTLLLTSVKVNSFFSAVNVCSALASWLKYQHHRECERRQTQHLEEILFIFLIQRRYKSLLNIIRSRFVEEKLTDPRRNSREPFKDSENQAYNCNLAFLCWPKVQCLIKYVKHVTKRENLCTDTMFDLSCYIVVFNM